LKKGPFVDARLLEKVKRMREKGPREPVKTWARACTVIPDFVGHTFLVHNGKNHMKVYVSEEMVGHKLGEFAPTRIFRGHSGRKKEEAGAMPGAGPPRAGATPAAPAAKK
jgi:small subunit ribosomal protein S19